MNAMLSTALLASQMQIMISGSVGETPRPAWSKGPAVRNRGEDVALIRRMLIANGYNVHESQRVDHAMVLAIKSVQEKLGMKNPDGVVDPNGKTHKALQAKYVAVLKKAAAEEAKKKLYKITYRGKTVLLEKHEYDQVKKTLIGELEPLVRSMVKRHKVHQEIYQSYLDHAMLKEGLMKAVVDAIIIKVGRVKMPSNRLCTAEIKAVGALERAMAKKDLEAIEKTMPAAEKALNAFDADLDRFLKEFMGSAKAVGVVSSVTSAVCFTIVGAIACPVLVGAGMSKAGAAVVGGAGVGFLTGASKELGHNWAGTERSAWEIATTLVVDTWVGAATGGIGSKIPAKFLDDVAEAVASRLAAKLPWSVTGAKVVDFVTNYIKTTFQKSWEQVLKEAVELLGKAATSGKIPTDKDFKQSVADILYTALTAGIMKEFTSFNSKWQTAGNNLGKNKLVPDRLSKFVDRNELDDTARKKLVEDVNKAVCDKVLKKGYDTVLDEAPKNDSAARMLTAVEKKVSTDKAIQALIDREIAAWLKKNNKKK